MAKRQEKYLNLSQVAEMLGTSERPLSKRTLLRWLAEGKFKGAHKLGEHTSPWRIPESAVDRLIKTQRDQAPKA